VGDRRQIAGRVTPLLLGQARRHRQGEKRQSQRGCLQKTLKHRRSPPYSGYSLGTRPVDRKIMENIQSMLVEGGRASTVSARVWLRHLTAFAAKALAPPTFGNQCAPHRRVHRSRRLGWMSKARGSFPL